MDLRELLGITHDVDDAVSIIQRGVCKRHPNSQQCDFWKDVGKVAGVATASATLLAAVAKLVSEDGKRR